MPSKGTKTSTEAGGGQNFSAALREGTAPAHTLAENMAFIRAFLRGAVDRPSYTRLLRGLYFVYEAMEAALGRRRDHPVVAPVFHPALERLPALAADLEFFDGPGWAGAMEASPATAAYVARIGEVERESPDLLVAHSYVRYLGDLSGGQMLRAIARRSLGLEGDAGTAFYCFADIPDPKAFKDRYRAALDGLPLDPAGRAAVIDEANRVFRLNMGIFSELEGSAIKGFARTVLGRAEQA